MGTKKQASAALAIVICAVALIGYLLLGGSARGVEGIANAEAPPVIVQEEPGEPTELVALKPVPDEPVPILLEPAASEAPSLSAPDSEVATDELRGVVRFSDGSPVTGIRINLYSEKYSGKIVGSGATDAEGRFSTEIDRARIVDNIYVKQSSATRGVATNQLKLSESAIPADSRDVELTMLGGILSVRIVDSNGTPEARALLKTTFFAGTDDRSEHAGSSSIIAGADGIARIIHSGRGTLVTTAFEHAGGGESRPVELSLAPGLVAAKEAITIDQLNPSALDLYITDEGGVPVEPVAFNLFLMSGGEIESGRYFEFSKNDSPITIQNIRSGDYQIRMRRPLGAGAICYQARSTPELEIAVVVGANQAAVKTKPGSGLELEIYGAAEGNGVVLEVRIDDLEWVPQRSVRRLDGEAFSTHSVISEDGRYALDGMAATGYYLRAVSKPENEVVSKEVFVDAAPGLVVAVRLEL